MNLTDLKNEALQLLQDLIAIPSFSIEEDQTADRIEKWLGRFDIPFERYGNNVLARNKFFDSTKPNILLNSHHDTVKPNGGYTKDPFTPEISNGKLFGLGSNDAGGALVSLLATFVQFYPEKNLKYNLIIVASAEEENSGSNGLNSVLSKLPEIDFAIVGEPTEMHLAISEKGLLVLDCVAHGQAGHAAHGLGDNAIYKAIEAIEWFRTFEFPKISETLGKIKMTVTQIDAGSQHNVIPASCHFVVDVRVTDQYTNTEVLEIIKSQLSVEVNPRSLRLNSSSIPKTHPIVQAGIKLGRKTYGSPTLSDQSVLNCQSLKLGPGDSHRSHTADEYIYVHEVEEGIDIYVKLLETVLF
ncbi:MAG: M20 family metallo-hydrolase [Flavobacteriaceae bacterium]|nr:M20 family metallo-hydrolase [Flavobacteriaceae bacterium]MDZ4148306.1 M20 family metallo-hydrolase [Flavobacteriaceae bacterium]